MKKIKRVVYCIGGTFNSGGMERVLANKANYLAAQGITVAIVTTDQQQRAPYFTLNELISCFDLGINYTASSNQNILQKGLGYLVKQWRHRRKLRRLLKELKADVVISMFDNDANLLWGIQDGSKKILEAHFSRFKRLQYGRRGLWKRIDAWRSEQDLKVAKQYDKFVVLTEEDKEYWGELPNMTVIPNAHSFAPEQPAALANKRVIAVGRYDYQKGFDELIAAWASVKEVFPDWQLHIFGKGELEEAYRKQIKGLDLQDVVRLCPPTEKIAEEYLSSSIFAMTSRYEGLPMAMLEAQACGLPLVAYACKCGPRDIIVEGQNGYLIPEGDQAGMANALIRLMQDEELRKRMGSNARHESAQFSEEGVMKRWMDLLDQLINKQ